MGIVEPEDGTLRTSDPTAQETPESALPIRPLWERIRLFEGLEPATTNAIAARLHRRSFAAGDMLIHQDHWCGELFIVRSGVVQVSHTPAEPGPVPMQMSHRAAPREVALRRLVSGDCFGEMSLLTGTLPSATVRALTAGEAWVLDQDAFQQLARAHPGLTQNINVILSERLAHTNRQHAQHPAQRITLIIGEMSSLWRELSHALTMLTDQATLAIDFTPTADPSGTPYDLDDLLSGRLNSTPLPWRDQPHSDHRDVIMLHGIDVPEQDATGIVANLLGALSRLEDRYRQVLMILPPDRPHLIAPLLAVATHVLVAGSVNATDVLRRIVSALPMPASLPIYPEIGVIVTEASPAIMPTAAMIGKFSDAVGAPVRAVVSTSGARRAAAIAALARWLVGQRIGLALGGGGSKGWAHLGTLRVLDRHHVPFDCIAGVSVGAMVGALIAKGTPLDELEDLLRIGSAHVFHPTISANGLLSSRALARFLRRKEVFGERLIEELPTSFAAVATDLTSGSEIVIRHGAIWQAVLASAAIPALFPPVRIGPYNLVDGAVVNPVPVSTAQLLGADRVIAVDISAMLSPRQEIADTGHAAEKLPNMVTAMLRSFEIMAAQIRAHAMEEPGVLIKAQITALSLRRFSDGVQFVEAGEAAAEAALPQLFQEFPWLRRMAP